jgi:Protein of unknown function (DUF2946)
MRRLRNRLGWLSWISVIAVLGNVVAGAFGFASARGTAGLDDMFGAHLMCTGDAVQTEAPGGGQDREGKSAHCALCTLLAGFTLAIALVFAAIAFPSTCTLHPLRFDLTTLADHLSLGGIRSRAPPLTA